MTFCLECTPLPFSYLSIVWAGPQSLLAAMTLVFDRQLLRRLQCDGLIKDLHHLLYIMERLEEGCTLQAFEQTFFHWWTAEDACGPCSWTYMSRTTTFTWSSAGSLRASYARTSRRAPTLATTTIATSTNRRPKIATRTIGGPGSVATAPPSDDREPLGIRVVRWLHTIMPPRA